MQKWFFERVSLQSQIKLRDFKLDIEGEETKYLLYPPSCETHLFTEYEEILQAAQEDPLGVEAPYVPVMLTCNGYEFSHEGAVEEMEKRKNCEIYSEGAELSRFG